MCESLVEGSPHMSLLDSTHCPNCNSAIELADLWRSTRQFRFLMMVDRVGVVCPSCKSKLRALPGLAAVSAFLAFLFLVLVGVLAARAVPIGWSRSSWGAGPLAPVLTPLLLMHLEPRLHIAASDLEPIRSIGRLGAPVLIAAGSRDAHTTLEESRELFDAAAEPKSLWIVEGARHQDLLAYDRLGYEEHAVGFLMKALGTR